MLTDKSLSSRLAELIKQNNTNAAKVASAIGVNRATITRIIKEGKDDISTNTLKKLATHFNVSCDYLLGLSDQPAIDLEMKDICEKTHLSEKAINNINRTIESHNDEKIATDNINHLLEYENLYKVIIGISFMSDMKLKFGGEEHD